MTSHVASHLVAKEIITVHYYPNEVDSATPSAIFCIIKLICVIVDAFGNTFGSDI